MDPPWFSGADDTHHHVHYVFKTAFGDRCGRCIYDGVFLISVRLCRSRRSCCETGKTETYACGKQVDKFTAGEAGKRHKPYIVDLFRRMTVRWERLCSQGTDLQESFM